MVQSQTNYIVFSRIRGIFITSSSSYFFNITDFEQYLCNIAGVLRIKLFHCQSYSNSRSSKISVFKIQNLLQRSFHLCRLSFIPSRNGEYSGQKSAIIWKWKLQLSHKQLHFYFILTTLTKLKYRMDKITIEILILNLSVFQWIERLQLKR